MKEIIEKSYECEKCGSQYSTAKKALKCEVKKIKHDYGIKVGDIVLITSGDGAGYNGKVKSTTILGNYDLYYLHTVALEVDIINSWGSRLLTFDAYQYKNIKK